MIVTCQRDLGCVGPDNAPAQHHDVRRSHARHAAEQNAAAAVGRFQILRSHLHGHASGHFAHRCEQRQRAVPFADRFVSNTVDASFEHPVGKLRQRREVEIGEQGEIGTEEAVFGRLRLFHLDDEVGTPPHLFRVLDDGAPGQHIFAIGERTAFTRGGLDEHFVPGFAECGDSAGDQADTGFVVFDFLGNADDHGAS
jgi:hypothetical protein